MGAESSYKAKLTNIIANLDPGSTIRVDGQDIWIEEDLKIMILDSRTTRIDCLCSPPR